MRKVKEFWDLMHVLEESGYTRDLGGGFICKDKTPYASAMFQYCGKEKPRIWTWAPEGI